MIREEIKKYMAKNKEDMAFSHLEVWFTPKYQGVSQKECKRLLKEEHDNSQLYEELEEHFGELEDKEQRLMQEQEKDRQKLQLKRRNNN